AADGRDAIAQVRRLRPSLVTLDVFLPGQDGIAVAQEIMQRAAAPILVVTAVNPRDPQLVYRALAAGALEVWPKPPAPHAADYDEFAATFCSPVRPLAGFPMVTRRAPAAPIRTRGLREPVRVTAAAATPPVASARRSQGDRAMAILIGASPGGPPV